MAKDYSYALHCLQRTVKNLAEKIAFDSNLDDEQRIRLAAFSNACRLHKKY